MCAARVGAGSMLAQDAPVVSLHSSMESIRNPYYPDVNAGGEVVNELLNLSRHWLEGLPVE